MANNDTMSDRWNSKADWMVAAAAVVVDDSDEVGQKKEESSWYAR